MIPILMYHSVDLHCDPAYRRWMVLPDEFEAQLQYFLEVGYKAYTITELIAARTLGTLPKKAFAITFDDGLHDFKTGAMPVLSKLGLPATLFVATGYVGATSRWLGKLGEGGRQMLSWRELAEISAQGIELGGHTVSHPQLDVLDVAKATLEIRSSKLQLEESVGKPVTSFAYPHGYSSRKTREIVREAGFQCACRVRHALSSNSENQFALSRIIMTSDLDADKLEVLLSNNGLPVAPPTDRLIADGWRLFRKLQAETGIEIRSS